MLLTAIIEEETVLVRAIVGVSHLTVVIHGVFITGISIALNYGGANMTWIGPDSETCKEAKNGRDNCSYPGLPRPEQS
jgi:hypothetical protein